MSWPGEDLLGKIWDTLANNGVGGLLRPRQIRREEAARTAAREHDLLTLAQASTDARDIVAGRKRYDGTKLIDVTPASAADVEVLPPPSDSHDTIARRIEARDFQRALNLERIAIFTEQEAEAMKDQPVSPEPVDPDWFARWRSLAEDVSREDMQRLWSRLLAGEIRQPGSFSQHTVQFLARMSKRDAELIERAAGLQIGGGAIYTNEDMLSENGLSFLDLLYLNDIGIINGVIGIGGLHYKAVVQEHQGRRYAMLGYIDRAIIAFTEDKAKESWEIPAYTISIVGRELMTLAAVKVNSQYMNAIARHALASGFVRVSFGRVTKEPDGSFAASNLTDFVP